MGLAPEATMDGRLISISALAAFVALAAGCGAEDPYTKPAWEPRDAILIPPWQRGCESAHVPLVMAHGFLASGDTYANHVMRFEANGYCQDRMFVYDWNSMGFSESPENLDAFVDEVLAATGASQVDLMGHSAGGGIGYAYLADAARAAKVRRYVHIGSGETEGPAGPDGDVPTLNLYSSDDRIVMNGGIPGADNVDLVEADHYEVATSTASFSTIYAFLNGGAEPEITEIAEEGDVIYLAGRALSLGENVPVAGGEVEIYEVEPGSGARTASRPLARFAVSDQGYWGPYQGRPHVPYELVIVPPSGTRVHYYREPLVRTNTKLYLRTLPSGGGLVGVLVSALRFDEDQPGSVIFLANRGLQPGDELTMDELDLSGDEYTNRDNTNIALFFYDANGNGVTDGTPVGLFESFPFLAGIDFAPGVDASVPSVATFNGRSLWLPRRSSVNDGVGIAVFE
jgi:pimeloyl-ACP methyl ester carboxylesterase